MVIIDAWMQHPSAEFLADPMFDSLRRWARGQLVLGTAAAPMTTAKTMVTTTDARTNSPIGRLTDSGNGKPCHLKAYL